MAEDTHDPEETPRVTLRMVYCGPCLTTEKKPGGKWRIVKGEGKYGDVSVYTSKGMTRAHVGEIREIDATDEEGSSVYGSGRYVGMAPKEDRIEWEMQAAIFNAERESERRRKDEATSAIKEILEPLREQYQKRIGYKAKAAMLATIITYITE